MKITKLVKWLAAVVAAIIAMLGCSGQPDIKVDSDKWNTNYKYIFVHGLSGWGSYDPQYKLMPYWGMFGGDLMKYLNSQGFECYAASVAPTSSAWDRACELYAQLTGTVVDYGKEHSERCKHARFGTDFSKKPLIGKWDAENKINILGHSFGGTTVRIFSELMANGSEAERKVTDEGDISAFFTGGKADWIYSVTTLSSPNNGTTAYNINDKIDKTESPKNQMQTMLTKLIQLADNGIADGRIEEDCAACDMFIDTALEMNKGIGTLKNAYYFAVPCSATIKAEDGTYYPDESNMEALFVASSRRMGVYTGVTEKGYVIDESWQENDGLVNTISAAAPFGAPSKAYDENSVTTGIWNIMPTYKGDHMSLQGGLLKTNDIKGFYVDFLDMINCL